MQTRQRWINGAVAIGVALAGVALVAALLLGGARAVAGGDPDRATQWSPVIYPLQRLPLAFSHATHLARGTRCEACHPAATTSRSAIDNLLPTEAECRACHPIDRAQPELTVAGAPPAACRACHPGYAPDVPIARVYLTPPPLKFDHSAHRASPCAICHGDLRGVGLATTQHLPTMATCLGCHRRGATPSGCAECHLTRPGGTLETEFEHGTLVPAHTGLGDAHGPAFRDRHTQEARQLDASCSACHDQSECVACHVGVVKPLDFHPGNYVLTHSLDARRGKPDCAVCHRAQSFCAACHERTGVGLRGDTQFGAGSPGGVGAAFHPPGWAIPGGTNHHAREARRSIASCASCHREDDCLKCHSAQPGSPRASPHPPNWRNSARCEALDRANRRMCLRCHITADELGCGWSR